MPGTTRVTARTVLYGILPRSGLNRFAHQTIKAEQDRGSPANSWQLSARRSPRMPNAGRWVGLVKKCGLDEADIERVVASESFGPLTGEFRRAEANGYNLNTLLPRLVAS